MVAERGTHVIGYVTQVNVMICDRICWKFYCVTDRILNAHLCKESQV